jgi:hypothetical protein
VSAPAAAVCAECGAALASDQRYCLECGARRGARSPALERVLAGLAASAWMCSVRGTAGPRRSSPGVLSVSWGALPGPRTAAVLTLAMLGFGTLAGEAVSHPAASLAALRRGPLTLVMPAPAPATAGALSASSAPPVQASATPEPAAASTESSAAEPFEGSSANGTHSKPAGGSGAGGAHGEGKSGGGSHAGGSTGSGSGGASKLPPIKHVFVIELADEPYALTFGPESPAPYLAHTLERRGELLPRVYAVAHEALADEVALISGLGPTPQTAADCPTYADILPSLPNKEGQYVGGQGCIYPRAAETIGNQLEAKHLAWRVYAEALGQTTPSATPTACWHPEFNTPDPTSQAPPGERFATFRDPFSYFDDVIHSPGCAEDDVPIERLAVDLRSAARTPAFSYIVPDLCDDGRPTPCVPGGRGGLPAAEGFLRRVVPEILAAPAYRKNGLLIITADQAPATGEYGDSSSCCLQPRFPAPAPALAPAGATGPTGPTGPTGATGPAGAATTTPGQPSTATTTPGQSGTATTPAQPGVELPPSGGGQVGALLLSPYVKPGTSNQEPVNDFSLLRTIEEVFGLPYLGYAGAKGVSSLEAGVFSGYTGR